MKVTKLEHSGVIVEENDKRIVFDPVEFEKKLPELSNVVAIIITHKHGDHLQKDKIEKIQKENPEARLLVVEDAADEVVGAEVVRPGDVIKAGEFELEVFGENHAEIVAGEVPCKNIGVVVNRKLINPGDSFDIPNEKVDSAVLLVANAAPWLKIAESMKYVEKMQPRIVIPVHDALLSEFGKGVQNNWLKRACDEFGAEFCALEPGASVEI